MKHEPRSLKILVIRFTSLGDVVLTTPVLSRLRQTYPDAQIDMIVKNSFADCIRGNPHINELIEFDAALGFHGLFRCLQKIRQKKYDILVDIHRSLRSRLILLFVSGKKLKYSKDTWRRLALLKLRWNLYDEYPRKILDYLKPLAKLGIDTSFEKTLMTFSPEELAKAQDIAQQSLLSKKIAHPDPESGYPIRIGLAPGAAHFLKKWPLEKYKELIYILSQRHKILFYVFGGPDDFECENLGNMPGPVVNLQNKLKLKQTAALISTCHLFIGNDSGLSHVAEAVGVDVFVFFGPTSQHFGYYPYRPLSQVFSRDLTCRPCTRNGKGSCSNSTLKKCLVDISSAEIASQISEYLTQNSHHLDTGKKRENKTEPVTKKKQKKNK